MVRWVACLAISATAIALLATNNWDWLSIRYWVELSDELWTWFGSLGQGGRESNSTTTRNVGLVIGGVIAIGLAAWRSKVAQNQAETARQDLLNERYQKDAEMLGDETLPVRLGGIYALQRLALEHPKEYHVQIMRLMCAFVRDPKEERLEDIGRLGDATEADQEKRQVSLRQDVQDAMEAICTRSATAITIEQDADFRLDLRGAKLRGLDLKSPEIANLSGAWLTGVDLSGVWLNGADLSNAVCWEGGIFSNTRFHDADLSGMKCVDSMMRGAKFNSSNQGTTNMRNADFTNSDLSHATFWQACMTDVNLLGVDLSRAEFSLGGGLPARGLTQIQLNSK